MEKQKIINQFYYNSDSHEPKNAVWQFGFSEEERKAIENEGNPSVISVLDNELHRKIVKEERNIQYPTMEIK